MTATSLHTDPIALDDRTRRVLELRRAIIEGTYEIDATAIATALLRAWAANAATVSDDETRVPPPTMESMRHFLVRIEPNAASGSERPDERRILIA